MMGQDHYFSSKLKEYELERGGRWGYIKNIMNKEANLSKGGEMKKFTKRKMKLEKGGGRKAKLEIIKEHDEKKDHEHHLK